MVNFNNGRPYAGSKEVRRGKLRGMTDGTEAQNAPVRSPPTLLRQFAQPLKDGRLNGSGPLFA